jgi:phenylalanyl-tRNA synthetase beta chain
MGGKNSEVRSDTMTVVLESAYFEPTGIRRMSKRLGLASESSRRFERGVDPNGTVDALNRLTNIICEIAGGIPTVDWVDIKAHSFASLKIRLETSEIWRILGVDIPVKEVKSILTRLGMTATQAGKTLVIKIPTYRPDITRPIDAIEEIARLYGYHRIKATMPVASVAPLVRPRFVSREHVARHALFGCGFSEAVLMAFTAREYLIPFADVASTPIEVSNPLSKDETVMRTVLLSGLLKAAAVNHNRQRYDVHLFALQRVYIRDGVGDIHEPLHLGGILTGRRYFRNWDGNKETVDFYDAKGAVEAVLKSMAIHKQAVWQRADDCRFLHPGRAAHVLLSNRRIGLVGQLHPDVAKLWDIDLECFVFEMDFEMLANLSLIERPQFSELSRFPFVERDLALIVDESIPSLEVLRTIQNSGVPLVSEVRVFDVYRGKGIITGKKSMAYTIRYSSPERTLTDDEVNEAHNLIVKTLQQKLGAVLRT